MQLFFHLNRDVLARYNLHGFVAWFYRLSLVAMVT